MRLGIYLDAMYRAPGGAGGPVLTNFELVPFLRFGAEIGRHFDAVVLIGREAPDGVGVDHVVAPGATLAPLPYYPSLAHLGEVARAVARTLPALWRALDRVDVVWCFGPHPFSLLLALLALARRRRPVLGVRQDTMRYFRSRLRSRRSAPLLAPLWLLDAAWRLLARVVPTVVVGAELEARYRGPRPGVHAMTVSLVPAGEVASAPRPGPAGEDVALLTVGRIDREKHPLLLVEALAELQRRAAGRRRFRLVWVGTGRLEDAVRRRARALGVEDAIELPGFVAPGPALLDRYREADVFVHVALTEGVPQVLVEALATATPVVATAVGGVARALDHGRAGLLVPPGDRDALVRAVLDVVEDDAGRRARAAHGLALARERTLEAGAAAVAAWMRR